MYSRVIRIISCHASSTAREGIPISAAVGVEAGEVPAAQAVEGDVGRARVAELLDQLVVQRRRELVRLDEAAPPLAAHPVRDRWHGGMVAGASGPRIPTLGGGFPTCATAIRSASVSSSSCSAASALAGGRRRRPAARPRTVSSSSRIRSVSASKAASAACIRRCTARWLRERGDELGLARVAGPRGPRPGGARCAPAASRPAPRAAAARARRRARARPAARRPARRPPGRRRRGCRARSGGRPRAARSAAIRRAAASAAAPSSAPLLVALRRVLGQRAGDHGVERGVARHRRRRLGQVRPELALGGVERERHLAGERVEEHAAERVEVARRAVALAPDALGRDVVERADDVARAGVAGGLVERLDEPEVGQVRVVGARRPARWRA